MMIMFIITFMAGFLVFMMILTGWNEWGTKFPMVLRRRVQQQWWQQGPVVDLNAGQPSTSSCFQSIAATEKNASSQRWTSLSEWMMAKHFFKIIHGRTWIDPWLWSSWIGFIIWWPIHSVRSNTCPHIHEGLPTWIILKKMTSASSSLVVSATLAGITFFASVFFKETLVSSEKGKVFGGFLCSLIFMFILTAYGSLKTIKWWDILLCLIPAELIASSIHGVCITTCFLFSMVIAFEMYKVSQQVYGSSEDTSDKKRR